MLTSISNLWTIVIKLPAIISIVKTIIDILGSDTSQKLFEAIRETVKKSDTSVKIDTLPAPERKRFIERLLPRVGQRLLGLTDSQYAATMQAFDLAEDAAIA